MSHRSCTNYMSSSRRDKCYSGGGFLKGQRGRLPPPARAILAIACGTHCTTLVRPASINMIKKTLIDVSHPQQVRIYNARIYSRSSLLSDFGHSPHHDTNTQALCPFPHRNNIIKCQWNIQDKKKAIKTTNYADGRTNASSSPEHNGLLERSGISPTKSILGPRSSLNHCGKLFVENRLCRVGASVPYRGRHDDSEARMSHLYHPGAWH
ncbi:hypothetical protein Zmor_024872 [Zophobas morio]|uniref:Uncharacterized protein n=1 Tax=Zophobas morio TaxID=2755281 RepID=A0AA38M406_9CUCU|nr:hypothetical protein Zmor_024872 [Zophobas morio]